MAAGGLVLQLFDKRQEQRFFHGQGPGLWQRAGLRPRGKSFPVIRLRLQSQADFSGDFFFFIIYLRKGMQSDFPFCKG